MWFSRKTSCSLSSMTLSHCLLRTFLLVGPFQLFKHTFGQLPVHLLSVWALPMWALTQSLPALVGSYPQPFPGSKKNGGHFLKVLVYLSSSCLQTNVQPVLPFLLFSEHQVFLLTCKSTGNNVFKFLHNNITYNLAKGENQTYSRKDLSSRFL